jgi:hypothetical protein
MFGGLGINELLVLMLIIALLSVTGIWPAIIRGLRELRGERVDPPGASSTDLEVPYMLLGCSPTASWEDVQRAYHLKAKQLHPDRGEKDGDLIRALNEAYHKIKKARGK